jgi:hypothetical protein
MELLARRRPGWDAWGDQVDEELAEALAHEEGDHE